MTLDEAIRARHSIRAYTGEPLQAAAAERLRKEIDTCNAQGCLHIQLIEHEPRAFQGRLARYGKFSGVESYIVMAGRRADDLDERVGYYGERLVLLAQTLGLCTCWVGLSYKKIPDTYRLAEGEKVVCYISIGYPAESGKHHKRKKPEQVSNVGEATPEWFRKGVEAALLAPTAINQQKFRFEYQPSAGAGKDIVIAQRLFSLVGYTKIDLGIAKFHFEIGAGREHFDWAE